MPVYDKTLPSGTKRRRIVVWVNGKSHEKLWSAEATKREAKIEEARWYAELLAVEPAPKVSKGDAPPTLFDFSRGTYAEHAMVHLGKKTWEIRVFKLSALCGRHEYGPPDRRDAVELGLLKLTEIATECVERYKLGRLAEGWQASTINGELAALSAVLAYARSLPIPCASPTIKFLPERGKGRVKAWTREQAGSLLAAAERHRPEVYPLLVFLAYTGCRKGEGLACETSWIDLEADTLRIEPNPDWQPKDGEPREVPIEPALRPWLDAAKKSGRRHAFVSRDGARWVGFPRAAFEACVALAGQCEACARKDADARAEDLRQRMLYARQFVGGAKPKARREKAVSPVASRCSKCAPALRGSPHKLRHTYASIFLAAGGSIYALSKILGHASIKTTEKRYAHFLPEALEGARGLVNLGPAVGPAAMEARKRWATK